MRAVFIDEWKATPYVKIIPVPKPKKGEVLIKVMAAPIHPAVLSYKNQIILHIFILNK